MTARLEEALKRLSPDAVEQVADFAESLAKQQQRQKKARHLSLEWFGIAKEADDDEDTVEIQQLLRAAQDYRLDFDDAYQYVVAEKHDLQLVSFDTDFDRTPRGRITPAQATGP